jgi:hypothetical protein
MRQQQSVIQAFFFYFFFHLTFPSVPAFLLLTPNISRDNPEYN